MKTRTTNTYSALIILVYLRNLGKRTKSKKHLVEITDKLEKKLKISTNITYSTKIGIINELISTHVLKVEREGLGCSVGLSRKSEKYIIDTLEDIIEVDDDEQEE